MVAFSPEEWRAVGELMDRALALPEMQLVLEDAALAYGEIWGQAISRKGRTPTSSHRRCGLRSALDLGGRPQG